MVRAARFDGTLSQPELSSSALIRRDRVASLMACMRIALGLTGTACLGQAQDKQPFPTPSEPCMNPLDRCVAEQPKLRASTPRVAIRTGIGPSRTDTAWRFLPPLCLGS